MTTLHAKLMQAQQKPQKAQPRPAKKEDDPKPIETKRGVKWLFKTPGYGIVQITDNGRPLAFMVLPMPSDKARVFEMTRLNGSGNTHRFVVTLGQSCGCCQQTCRHLPALAALDRQGKLDFEPARKEHGPRYAEVPLKQALGTGWATSKAGKKYPVAVLKKVEGYRVMVADLKNGTAHNDYGAAGYFVEEGEVADIRWFRG